MERRHFLVSAVSIPTVLTGCAQINQVPNQDSQLPIARLTMKRVTDSEIGNLAVDYSHHSLSQDQRILIEQTTANNHYTDQAREPIVPAEATLTYDNQVYRATHEIIDSQQAYLYSITLNHVDENKTNDTKTIEYTELPAVDQQKLVENRLSDGSNLGIGTGMTYTIPERKQSILVPNSNKSVIVWPSGQRGRFSVSSSTQIELLTYRYTVTETAPTVTAYGQRIRSQYAFKLNNLSSPEQTIIEKAIGSDNKYIIDSRTNVPAGLTSLADKLREHESIKGSQGASGVYLLKYHGELYWTNFYINIQRITNST